MRRLLIALVWLLLAACEEEPPRESIIYTFYSNRAVESLVSSRGTEHVICDEVDGMYRVSVVDPSEEYYHFRGGYKLEFIGDSYLIFLHGMAVRPRGTVNNLRYYELY